MWSYLFVKNTTKTKISASQRISIKNCINYDHNKNVGLFKLQSGYRKLYLNSPKGYSRKIFNAQTDKNGTSWKAILVIHISIRLVSSVNSVRIQWLSEQYYRIIRQLLEDFLNYYQLFPSQFNKTILTLL